MEACREELTLSRGYIERNAVFVIEDEDDLIGFCSLEHCSDATVELGYIFIDPPHIGKGYGRRLITHVKQEAKSLGYKKVIIQGDPNAERFYRAMRGSLVGTRKSKSIPKRRLPLFVISLRK